MLSIQLGRKSTLGSSNSTAHEEKKSYGEIIFSKTGPHNRPHEFKNKTKPGIPKFLDSKERIDPTYGVKEATNDCQQLSE